MTREIIRHHDAEDLAASTAARLVTTLAQVQADFGSASLMLTGGRIAGSLLFSLADPIAAEALDWSRLDLWWGDERYLPAGDVERNDWLADTRLLSQVAIPPAPSIGSPGRTPRPPRRMPRRRMRARWPSAPTDEPSRGVLPSMWCS